MQNIYKCLLKHVHLTAFLYIFFLCISVFKYSVGRIKSYFFSNLGAITWTKIPIFYANKGAPARADFK